MPSITLKFTYKFSIVETRKYGEWAISTKGLKFKSWARSVLWDYGMIVNDQDADTNTMPSEDIFAIYEAHKKGWFELNEKGKKLLSGIYEEDFD